MYTIFLYSSRICKKEKWLITGGYENLLEFHCFGSPWGQTYGLKSLYKTNYYITAV